MMNLHVFLSDAVTTIGAATGIVGLLRIDEVVIWLRSHTWMASEILRLRAEKKQAFLAMEAQHRGYAALQDGLGGVQARLEVVEAEQARLVAKHAETEMRLAEAEKRLGKLQPLFDGAIAYIHALTSWGLRLLRALKANRIHIGVDENLPKPPDVLLEYVPEEHRP